MNFKGSGEKYGHRASKIYLVLAFQVLDVIISYIFIRRTNSDKTYRDASAHGSEDILLSGNKWHLIL